MAYCVCIIYLCVYICVYICMYISVLHVINNTGLSGRRVTWETGDDTPDQIRGRFEPSTSYEGEMAVNMAPSDTARPRHQCAV